MSVTQQIEELSRAYARSRSAESKAKNRSAFLAQEERSLELLDRTIAATNSSRPTQ